MFRIIEGAGHRVILESTLDTIQAANNRLRMLRKHNPGTAYRVEPAPTYRPRPECVPLPARTPKVTVSRIPA